MIAQSFQYESPGTIAEAISLLQKYGDEAKILSGGHSLIPMMKLRFASPEYVIDINNIPGLSHIIEENGVIRIGALTRESEIEHSDLLKKHFSIVSSLSLVSSILFVVSSISLPLFVSLLLWPTLLPELHTLLPFPLVLLAP